MVEDKTKAWLSEFECIMGPNKAGVSPTFKLLEIDEFKKALVFFQFFFQPGITPNLSISSLLELNSLGQKYKEILLYIFKPFGQLLFIIAWNVINLHFGKHNTFWLNI